MSWIKKELLYLKESFSQIIQGFILFVFACSGLGVAILLRYLEFGGTIIAFIGIVIEAIAMILSYLIFRKFFKPRKEPITEETRKKQFYK